MILSEEYPRLFDAAAYKHMWTKNDWDDPKHGVEAVGGTLILDGALGGGGLRCHVKLERRMSGWCVMLALLVSFNGGKEAALYDGPAATEAELMTLWEQLSAGALLEARTDKHTTHAQAQKHLR